MNINKEQLLALGAKELRVRITFADEVLGTASSDPELHETYIASLAPDAMSKEEEVEAFGADEVIEKGMTIYPKEGGVPFFWDYQIRGFFKDTCGGLARLKGCDVSKESCKMKAYKKTIDNNIFVWPRKILVDMNGAIGNCQRPLRAQTAQGERVALANSETIPEGSKIEFSVIYFAEDHRKAVVEWLNYGVLKGIGQWRNSGKGKFVWEELDKDGNVIGGNKAA